MEQYRTFQLADIFKLHHIKNTKEAEKVLNSILNLFLYMKTGDELEFSLARFSKLSDDIIHIEPLINSEILLDSLEKKKIIHIPI